MKLIKLTLLAFIVIANLNVVFAQNLSKTKKNIFTKSSESSSNILQNSLDYTFLKTTGTYANLIGADVKSLTKGQTWDDPSFKFPIGFNFKLYDAIIDSLDFSEGSGGSLGPILGSTNQFAYLLSPLEADLIDRGFGAFNSISPITYKLEGQTPNRILKLEWRNAGFYGEYDILTSQNDFINFQMWLFETSNTIEFHYGSSSIVSPAASFDGETGPIVALGKFDTTNFNIIKADILTGSSSNPTVINSEGFLTGVPANGTIYRFTRNTTNLANIYQQNSKVRTYPNPALEEINLSYSLPIEAKNARVILYDLLGKEIQCQQLFGIEGAAVISFKDLANGTYLYKVLCSETGMLANGKLVVSK